MLTNLTSPLPTMSKNISMGSWSFNKNFDGVTEDFLEESLGFDDALKLFDFPLEPVEENGVVENWDAGFEGLELPLTDGLASLSATFGPQGCNESKKNSPSNTYSQVKQLPRICEVSGGRNSLHQKNSSSSKGQYYVFQTSSPVSVLESNSSSSNSNAASGRPVPFDSKVVVPVKRRSKRPRSSVPKTYSLHWQHNAERILNSGKRKYKKKKPSLHSPPEAVRRCTHCEETNTPQWREGPMGPRTLCNACGVRYRKSTLPPGGGKEGADDIGSEPIRKCTHCEATRTPQWREGPTGPKTLCNACGVRYRSGRLFPEYRPLSSPTFIKSLHSNSHRKVAELRKKSTHGGEEGCVS